MERASGHPRSRPLMGAFAHDTSTVSWMVGFTPTRGVNYSSSTNGACTAPTSSTQTVTAAGSFSFQASYGGDGNYSTSTSSCERPSFGGHHPADQRPIRNRHDWCAGREFVFVAAR
jgi:hypothetical protein